jgi:hypothetical protein
MFPTQELWGTPSNHSCMVPLSVTPYGSVERTVNISMRRALVHENFIFTLLISHDYTFKNVSFPFIQHCIAKK